MTSVGENTATGNFQHPYSQKEKENQDLGYIFLIYYFLLVHIHHDIFTHVGHVLYLLTRLLLFLFPSPLPTLRSLFFFF